MKQINHFDHYGFALPQITDWYFNYTDGNGNVDMRLYWDPMGSIVLEIGFCKSISNTMPGMESKYWSQTGNIPYSQTSSSNNPCGGFYSDIFYVSGYLRNVAGIVWSDVVVVNTKDSTTYPPSVTSSAISYKLSTIAQCGGEVTNDGGDPVTARGVCWNTNSAVAPTTSNDRTHDGMGTGVFTSKLTGLIPNTTCYVRAYATNSKGTSYGGIMSFTTDAAGVPTTETYDLQKTASYSNVNVYGRILDDGGAAITQHGFCWNTAGNPTLNDQVVYASGSGSGDFTALISGLPGSTDVHVKTFAINSYGVGIGGEWTFPTDAAPAGVVVFTLSTNSVSSVWKAAQINKTGTALHWEVTGAVTAQADGNAPTFNFSAPGTKYIVVTSTDGASGISTLNFYHGGLTDLSISGSPYITGLSVEDNALTSISIGNNTALTSFCANKNQFTSLDLSQNTALQSFWCDDNNLSSLNIAHNPSLTSCNAFRNNLSSISLSNNQALTILNLSYNKFDVSSINSLLDILTGYNNTGGLSFSARNQTPAITPAAAKVSALDAIWNQVLV